MGVKGVGVNEGVVGGVKAGYVCCSRRFCPTRTPGSVSKASVPMSFWRRGGGYGVLG